MNLSIVIPCFNEVDNVSTLRGELLPVILALFRLDSFESSVVNGIEVIFVDDGSMDDTFAQLKEAFGDLDPPGLSIQFVRHEVNRGLGAAIRTGFAVATSDLIITTDSDSTYKYTEIPGLLACMTPQVDIVTASPYHPDGGVVGVPPYRLILSRGSSFLYRILVSWRIHTYTSLFRAYRRKVIEEISFDADGFLAGTELMVKAMLKGYNVAEYPVALHQRTYGVSKAKLMRTIKAHLGFQLRVLFHRLRVWPLEFRKAKEGEGKWIRPVQSFPGANQK